MKHGKFTLRGHAKSTYANIWRFFSPLPLLRFRTFQEEPLPLRLFYVHAYTRSNKDTYTLRKLVKPNHTEVNVS